MKTLTIRVLCALALVMLLSLGFISLHGSFRAAYAAPQIATPVPGSSLAAAQCGPYATSTNLQFYNLSNSNLVAVQCFKGHGFSSKATPIIRAVCAGQFTTTIYIGSTSEQVASNTCTIFFSSTTVTSFER
jgi:hypothetical protein